jgi:hypothetical protein
VFFVAYTGIGIAGVDGGVTVGDDGSWLGHRGDEGHRVCAREIFVIVDALTCRNPI